VLDEGRGAITQVATRLFLKAGKASILVKQVAARFVSRQGTASACRAQTPFWQGVFIGTFIIVAVTFDRIRDFS
jgi:predicted ABC-type sugar transport system permease subunit